MNDYIAYCGLDCETCEARLATLGNDDELRIKVAEEWSKLNGVVRKGWGNYRKQS